MKKKDLEDGVKIQKKIAMANNFVSDLNKNKTSVNVAELKLLLPDIVNLIESKIQEMETEFDEL